MVKNGKSEHDGKKKVSMMKKSEHDEKSEEHGEKK